MTTEIRRAGDGDLMLVGVRNDEGVLLRNYLGPASRVEVFAKLWDAVHMQNLFEAHMEADNG